MGRATTLLLAVLSVALLTVAAVSDRALAARERLEAAEARREAGDRARLQALAVRAAIAQIEQGVGAGRVPAGVAHDTLALPPGKPPIVAPRADRVRPRDELAALLESERVTSQGFPEAAVAAILYGTEDARAGAAEKLLAGDLPIRPEDVPTLAAALGVAGDPRVSALLGRLGTYPDPSSLPRLPGFRRHVSGGVLQGFSTDGRRIIHYAAPGALVLELAGSPDDVRLDGDASGEDARVDVPDVAGMAITVAAAGPPRARLRIARGVLWLSMASVLGGLALTARALAREQRAVSRERAFLSTVTHELRTPLAGMRVLGETLGEGRGDPVEYGLLLAQETERMETLVEQVLAAARADEAPSFRATPPEALARSAVDVIRPRAERRRVAVRVEIARALPEAVWDAEAVRRALLNLLDNAVRHGASPGNVTLAVAAEGATVRLLVADDGPGIARRDRGRLFGRFTRGTTTAPGTGLGLYLVDRVARAHGGRVDLETAEGRGCRFTLVLPVVPPAAAGGGAPS